MVNRLRMSLFFYYSNERSVLHRELIEMVYWALMYAWQLGPVGTGFTLRVGIGFGTWMPLDQLVIG